MVKIAARARRGFRGRGAKMMTWAASVVSFTFTFTFNCHPGSVV
jgi:hypothetical protein